MYTWLWDFNLQGKDDEIERFLVSMVREWPIHYEKVPGVLGVAFFGNAFALAGSYTFRMVVDMKSLDTLAAIDQLYKTDATAKRAMSDFRNTRRDIKGRLLKLDSGDEVISASLNKAATPVFVYTFGMSGSAGGNSLGQPNLGGTAQHVYTPLVHAEAQHGLETWVSVPDLGYLEFVGKAASAMGSGSSQLFANFRIIDGALIGAA
jgi:hypothetical protein